MTAPTDDLARIARDSQDAVTAALTAWTETAEHYAKNFDARKPVPSADDAQAVVDTAYDLATKLLAGQHAFARTVLDAGKQAGDRFTESARRLAPFATA